MRSEFTSTAEMTFDDIRTDENRNKLLKVIGDKSTTRVGQVYEPIVCQPGDAFLLCSDGFWELIDENTMIELLINSSNVNEWLDKMISVVKTNGQNCIMDNNTAIAIWIE